MGLYSTEYLILLYVSMETLRQEFNKVPTPVKIIFYSGLALIAAQVTSDLQSIQGWYVEYLSIVVGVVTNLIAWRLLSLREE